MTYNDPRADLERLPSDTLYSIARNECAQHRVLALRLLVERGSRLALQPEIAEEARELKLIDPTVIDNFADKLDLNAQIAVLRAEHATDMQVTNDRLALIERSPWRKLADALRAVRRRMFLANVPVKYLSQALAYIRRRLWRD
jgi:hypothetical protein